MSDAKETCVLIDHDTGVVLVDTSLRGTATQLVRQGFQEVTSPSSRPYRRFSGDISQVSFRKGKSKGRVENGQNRAEKARSTKEKRGRNG